MLVCVTARELHQCANINNNHDLRFSQQVTCSSEMSVNLQHTIQHYNPEDRILQNHLSEPQILLTTWHHIRRDTTLLDHFYFLDYDIRDQCKSVFVLY
jgi:hypothetical protein